ncbi:MAG: U32 family peptidase [Elusimicrobia bacterium]|nr:U32 family peptidase [Elusimicrobiota bacterium]
MKKLELLAPARDLDTGIDAVNCGADAVYIGAEHFGARAGAANTVTDIGRLAAHAHKYRAKVYAAVNTVLTDEELPRAQKLITSLWEAGADGVIIQDMGLLETNLPPIPLIASTQTHNTTPEKVLFLEKVGFKRVILARELTLEEIKAIRAKTTVELEFFVHGALCVAYSGQCYLSQELGGRSGNRGDCAQPCRKPYRLSDAAGETIEANKHQLSLKDLNLSRRLGHLAAAGITSFKIEGRLKDRAYVRNVVSLYRRELDKLIEKKGYARASAGKSFTAFTPDPAKTFNRGYTEYFLDGNPVDVASPDTPKFLGEPLGRVFDVKEGSFKIHNAEKLHPGDGIAFFDKTGTLTGSLVNGVKDGRVRADNLKGLENGSSVFRNLDREFLKSVERDGAVRRFAVKLEFLETADGFALKASDERGIAVTKNLPYKKEAAKKPGQALDTIKKQLSKLGETAFYLEALDVKLSTPYFIPVSALNDLRRDALTALENAGAAAPAREELKLSPNAFPYPETKLDYTANVLNSRAAGFYKRHGVTETGKAAEAGADLTGRPLMVTRFCLRRRLGLCKKGKPVEPLYLEDAEGSRFRLEFDCAACRMRLFREAAARAAIAPEETEAPEEPED